jgi:hypothetical protein
LRKNSITFANFSTPPIYKHQNSCHAWEQDEITDVREPWSYFRRNEYKKTDILTHLEFGLLENWCISNSLEEHHH